MTLHVPTQPKVRLDARDRTTGTRSSVLTDHEVVQVRTNRPALCVSRRLAALLAMVSAMTGCSPGSSSSAPAVTVTVTIAASPGDATPHATSTTSGWPLETGGQGEEPSPQFPTAMDGWQLVDTWSDLPRAFVGDMWTKPSGPYGDEFPDTMNGCGTQRFLVRWRALATDATVLARWNTQDIEFGQPTSANAGWMDLDGCRAPEFKLAGETAAGSTLTDVTVSLQRWIPAP